MHRSSDRKNLVRSKNRRSRVYRFERLEPRNLLASVSAPPILQWFDGSFDTIEERLPDVFEAGFGALWLPPPGRADSGNQSVGYDPYDRFDLGSPDNETLYGTETGLKHLADLLDRTSTSLHIDAILNHAGFSDLSTEGFADSGGYPGLAITLDGAIDGDFHSAFAQGDLEFRLSGLVDIDHTTNHVLVRNPVDAEAGNNIPVGTITDPYGRLANIPKSENARFYPDLDGEAKFLFDPVTGESDLAVYSFDTADPMSGDAVAENALGYLMRYMQWMVQVIGVDGFRVDAAKHFDSFVMDYLDRAVYRSNPRTLLDGSTENVFSYSEVFDGNKDTLLSYVRKNIDPSDPGRIGGNRDVLDFSSFFMMRDKLSSPGTPNAWYDVRDSLLDLHDDGLHNGSAGVLFVRSHDEFGPTSLGNVAHAMALMYPGNAVVYFNGKEFGPDRDFPKAGRGDALGGVYGETIKRLLSIRQSHGRGDFYERWIDNEGIFIFERENSAIVGLSNRGDGGFDERTISVGFAPGTRLIELTGNASDPSVDPHDDLPDYLEVSSNNTVTIRIPRNQNANGDWHGSGYVIYGLATPQSSGIELTGVDSVLSGSVPEVDDYANGVTRLEDLHVVTGDQITVNLQTEEVYLDSQQSIRDISADGDQAMLRLDGGTDVNGNGIVDNVSPGSVTYGFEFFQDVASPLVGAEGVNGTRGTGQFQQQIDLSSLEEGVHFLEVRAFRHRMDGGQPVYSDYRESIYLDRLPPVSDVQSFLPYVDGVNENRNLVVRSLDKTANSVHVFLDLPAATSDSEILNLVDSSNSARKIDRDQFIYGFENLTSGNHVATVVSYERTGNVNVQRIPGLSISTVYGGGLGDLDFNGAWELADLNLFETLVLGEQSSFNPAADFDGNGLVDYIDLQRFSEFLVASEAQQELVTEMERIRTLLFRAEDESFVLSEDERLVVAANGVLGNDQIPGEVTGIFIVNAGVITSNRGVSASLEADGSWVYDARGFYDPLLDGQVLTDYFDYIIDDGFGNRSTARVELSIGGANDAPTFGSLSSIHVDEDELLTRLDLGVFDPDHSVDQLELTFTLERPELFALEDVELVLEEGAWFLEWELAKDQFGESTIVFNAEDPGADGLLETPADNLSKQVSFILTVDPVNDVPSFGAVKRLALDAGVTSHTILLDTITAGGGEIQDLLLTASVDNTSLLSLPITSQQVEAGSFPFEIQPVENAVGFGKVMITLEDAGLDGFLTTVSDNAAVTKTIDVAVGISSFRNDPAAIRVELRGTDQNVSFGIVNEQLVIDHGDAIWFSLNESEDATVTGPLALAIDETQPIEITSEEGVDLQFDPALSWRMGGGELIDGDFFREVIATAVEPAAAFQFNTVNPWQNLVDDTDVNNSGDTTAGDALVVINELSRRRYSDEDANAKSPADVLPWPGVYFDVSGDDRISALDALQVINRLRTQSLSEGSEGEWLPTSADNRLDVDLFISWHTSVHNTPEMRHLRGVAGFEVKDTDVSDVFLKRLLLGPDSVGELQGVIDHHFASGQSSSMEGPGTGEELPGLTGFQQREGVSGLNSKSVDQLFARLY